MKIIAITTSVLFVFVATVFAQEAAVDQKEENSEIPYSELRRLIDAGKVVSSIIWDDGWWVTGTLDGGASFETRVNPNTPVAEHLIRAGVSTKFVHRSDDEKEKPLWIKLFLNLLPLLMFLIFFGFVIIMIKAGNEKYYSRSEKMQADFFDRLEKILAEQKEK